MTEDEMVGWHHRLDGGELSKLQELVIDMETLDCSPPGSSVHGILQTRILEWIAMPSSRASSQPRDGTRIFCIAGRFFTI